MRLDYCQAALALHLATERVEQMWSAELRLIEGAITLKQGRTEQDAQASRIALETPTLLA